MSYMQRSASRAPTKWKVAAIECLRAPRLLDGCLIGRPDMVLHWRLSIQREA